MEKMVEGSTALSLCNADFCLLVSDDSLKAEGLAFGDAAFIKCVRENEISDGSMACVYMNKGSHFLLRRYYRVKGNEGAALLVAGSRKCNPILLNEDSRQRVEVVGVVVESRRLW